jgi:hypothetical protein
MLKNIDLTRIMRNGVPVSKKILGVSIKIPHLVSIKIIGGYQ